MTPIYSHSEGGARQPELQERWCSALTTNSTTETITMTFTTAMTLPTVLLTIIKRWMTTRINIIRYNQILHFTHFSAMLHIRSI